MTGTSCGLTGIKCPMTGMLQSGVPDDGHVMWFDGHQMPDDGQSLWFDGHTVPDSGQNCVV